MYWLNQAHPQRGDYDLLHQKGVEEGAFVLIRSFRGRKSIVPCGREIFIYPLKVISTREGEYRVSCAAVWFDEGGARIFPCWLDGKSQRKAVVEEWMQNPRSNWFRFEPLLIEKPQGSIWSLQPELVERPEKCFSVMMLDVEAHPGRWNFL